MTITFRGAYIRKSEVRNGENGRHIRLHLTTDWTDVVRDEMNWEDPSDTVAKCDLVGKLASGNLVMTPAGDLKGHEMQFAISSVEAFKLHPIKDKSGEVVGRELRFTVFIDLLDTEALIAVYVKSIGRAPAQVRISGAEQMELGSDAGGEETEESADEPKKARGRRGKQAREQAAATPIQ